MQRQLSSTRGQGQLGKSAHVCQTGRERLVMALKSAAGLHLQDVCGITRPLLIPRGEGAPTVCLLKPKLGPSHLKVLQRQVRINLMHRGHSLRHLCVNTIHPTGRGGKKQLMVFSPSDWFTGRIRAWSSYC